MVRLGRKEAKARGERYTSPVDVPSDGSDELIIIDKPSRAKSSGTGKAPPRVDPDEEESEGAWTVEDEEEMYGFIDDADKNEDDHDEISNLLPGESVCGFTDRPHGPDVRLPSQNSTKWPGIKTSSITSRSFPNSSSTSSSAVPRTPGNAGNNTTAQATKPSRGNSSHKRTRS